MRGNAYGGNHNPGVIVSASYGHPTGTTQGRGAYFLSFFFPFFHIKHA
jgi:hypothetical protein